MIKDKTVVLGITGGIAAHKMANVASGLKKLGINVEVIMTKNATNFIHPITFESLTGNKCLVDTFDRNFEFKVEHITIAKKADVFLVAPASANIIGKIVNGIADDMLTTTFLACKCKKLIAPAMNTNMYENPILQDNLRKCKKYGMDIILPASGYLACGDIGEGKLPEPEILIEYILKEIQCDKDMAGKKVLITAGPTREAIDPVRFISNHSTGKMGYSLAKCAMRRGAEVTLITGITDIKPPMFVNIVSVVSAEDMYQAVITRSRDIDIMIMAAAVADYTPCEISPEKIKKKDEDVAIPLKRTRDILMDLGKNKKKGQFLCGFAMETQDLIENAKKKLDAKNADMIVANSLKSEGAGFGTDTNLAVLVKPDDTIELPLMSKDNLADIILNHAVEKTQDI